MKPIYIIRKMAHVANKDELVAYKPPEWAEKLKNIPKYRLPNLSNDHTPIHKWDLPGLPQDFELHIKRIDMSGSDLSGNKVKKLEFLLADAIDKGCKSVVTVGIFGSNHCRSTALAARRAGLTPHIVVRSHTTNPDEVPCHGNTLLFRMAGAHVYLAPPAADIFKGLIPRAEQLVEKFRKEKNEKMYPIHVGGSSVVGIFGPFEEFQELLMQNVTERFTDIVVAVGSCGNLAGLAIGNYLTGSKLKIHGVNVVHELEYTVDEVNRLLGELGLRDSTQTPPTGLSMHDIVDIIEDGVGLGLAISAEEELEFLCDVATSTGVVLDGTFTGKAAFNMVKELKENPSRFQGNKILFVHTGGIFGIFDGRMDSVLKRRTNRNIHNWMELSEDAPFSVTEIN